MTDDLDTALEGIVADISRLRSLADAMDLPNDAKAKLLDHLSLASTAALRLRFKSGEDDIIAIDG